MEKPLAIRPYILLFLLLKINSIYSQNDSNIVFKRAYVFENIWEDPNLELIKSGIKTSIVFEGVYNDSINLFISDSLFFDGIIKTDRNLGIVYPAVIIKHSLLKSDTSTVSLKFIKRELILDFNLIKKYSFIYIEMLSAFTWKVDYSNYAREYE